MPKSEWCTELPWTPVPSPPLRRARYRARARLWVGGRDSRGAANDLSLVRIVTAERGKERETRSISPELTIPD